MEPTYRIAQRLHERRAAVGLKKYGQHLTADSPGCMLVHALEEAADQVNYLIAEIQRRQSLMKWLRVISDEKGPWADWAWGWFVDFGGEAALAKYDEILGTATPAPDPRDEALRVAEKALAFVCRNEDRVTGFDHLIHRMDMEDCKTALAAIRGAR